MSSEKHFNGDEMIADILFELPDSAEILASYGIGCAGCHVNQYESLKDGILGHGYGEKVFRSILDDLNESFGEQNQFKNLEITDLASEKLKDFKSQAGKENYGVRIEAERKFGSDDISYSLDFERVPDKNDRVFEVQDISIFCDHESFRLLKNTVLDFKTENGEDGFKFNKV